MTLVTRLEDKSELTFFLAGNKNAAPAKASGLFALITVIFNAFPSIAVHGKLNGTTL